MKNKHHATFAYLCLMSLCQFGTVGFFIFYCVHGISLLASNFDH
jgi:hypothetical protein